MASPPKEAREINDYCLKWSQEAHLNAGILPDGRNLSQTNRYVCAMFTNNVYGLCRLVFMRLKKFSFFYIHMLQSHVDNNYKRRELDNYDVESPIFADFWIFISTNKK